MPLMVRIQRDRNRVSSRNRPWLSIGVASMSPRRSLTTKVLPSRMLTVLSGMSGLPCVERGVHEGGPCAEAEHDRRAERPVALLVNDPAQGRDDDVDLAAQQPDQVLARRADGGDVDGSLVVRQREVTVVDDQYAQRLVSDQQAHAPGDSGERRRLRLPPLSRDLALLTLVFHDIVLPSLWRHRPLPRPSILPLSAVD